MRSTAASREDANSQRHDIANSAGGGLDVRAAILAGGTASRFGGRPKGLEQVGGERILDRVAHVLAAATETSPLLIANAAEAPNWRPDLRVVRDAIRDCGSLGGIYTALSACDAPVLVMAWDMPFVPVELLAELVKRSSDYDAFLPESSGTEHRLEPLCAVYRPSCLDAIRERLADEDFRASGFLDHVNLGTLSKREVQRFGDPETLLFNINTPTDLTKAQELWRSLHEH